MSWNDLPPDRVLPPITSIIEPFRIHQPETTPLSSSFFRDSTGPTRPSPPSSYPVYAFPCPSPISETRIIPKANSAVSRPQTCASHNQHYVHNISEADPFMSEYIHNDQSYGHYMDSGNTTANVRKVPSPNMSVYQLQPMAANLVPGDESTTGGIYYQQAYPMGSIPCQPVYPSYTASAKRYLPSEHHQEYGIPVMTEQPNLNQRHPSNIEFPEHSPRRTSQSPNHLHHILLPACQKPAISAIYQSSDMKYIPISMLSAPSLSSEMNSGATQSVYQQSQSVSHAVMSNFNNKSSATSSSHHHQAQYRDIGTRQAEAYIASDVALSRLECQNSSSSSIGRITVDAANTILAEKRRKNAGASARFRDRRRQKQKEADEKIRFLIAQIDEMKKECSKLPELETELAKIRVERDAALERVQKLEMEMHVLRNVVQSRDSNSSTRRPKRHFKEAPERDPVDEQTTDTEGSGLGIWPRGKRRVLQHSADGHQNTNSESSSITCVESRSRNLISFVVSASDCAPCESNTHEQSDDNNSKARRIAHNPKN